MPRHLESQEEFCNAFKEFCEKLSGMFKDEQNFVRLFDIWLANNKDERVIEHQFKKEPWQQGGDDSDAPWA